MSYRASDERWLARYWDAIARDLPLEDWHRRNIERNKTVMDAQTLMQRYNDEAYEGTLDVKREWKSYLGNKRPNYKSREYFTAQNRHILENILDTHNIYNPRLVRELMDWWKR